jgi:hypothetical protein
MLRKCIRLLPGIGLAALFSAAAPSQALAQDFLGSNLEPFAVMAGTTVTCAGASVVT